MAMLNRRIGYFDSEEGIDIRRELRFMTDDNMYNTESTYVPNKIQYPDNQIPFVEKHMNYLNTHPKLDARMYIANIRLKTRIRPGASL